MPDITKGKIFTTGEEVSASDMNSIIDLAVINSDAITESKIASGAVVNDTVSASANIVLSKLASGSEGQIPVCNALGVPTYVALTGDVTVDNAGETTIGDTSITLPMIVAGTEGDILYFGAEGAASLLGKGTDGQALQMNSAETAPEWAPTLTTGYASAQGTATSTALTSSLTNVGSCTLTLPAGKTWKWLRVFFSTKLTTNGGISGLTIKLADTDAMTWVGITTAIQTADSESDVTMVSYVQEGSPTETYESTTSLELAAYSQKNGSLVDQPASRQLYAVGEYE